MLRGTKNRQNTIDYFEINNWCFDSTPHNSSIKLYLKHSQLSSGIIIETVLWMYFKTFSFCLTVEIVTTEVEISLYRIEINRKSLYTGEFVNKVSNSSFHRCRTKIERLYIMECEICLEMSQPIFLNCGHYFCRGKY